MLGDLIQRSKSFQAERRKAEAEANRKWAEAADARRAEDGKLSEKPVPPQIEATQVKPQKRDHATESQRKASTALAQQVGVGRSVDGPSPHPHAGSLDYCYWRKLQ